MTRAGQRPAQGTTDMTMSRRDFLKTGAATAGLAALPPGLARAAAGTRDFVLNAGHFEQALTRGGPMTDFWGFNRSVPGPELRFRMGDRVRIVANNDLVGVDTTVHWHGLRVPNAMDGVPYVTQYPIKPGEMYSYEFQVQDSGTFWYHPHQTSFEQVPRGLYGPLIVEEDAPIEVDREVVWVLSDVRIDAKGRQLGDFGRVLDIANDGRLGNVVLVNGQQAGDNVTLAVRSGERVRLRLINAASARIFRLQLAEHRLRAIALDGQAIRPRALETVDLGPGMRVDLVVDFMAAPGSEHKLMDVDRRSRGQLARISYLDAAPVREKPLGAPIELAANDLPEPDVARAIDHYIVFQGGMRGSPVIGMIDGKPTNIQEILEKEKLAWTMNFSAQHEHALLHEPLLYVKKGDHVVLRLINETDFAHPMHLHGHFFRVVGVDGQPLVDQDWRDTVLMAPRQSVDVAFVADNLGEWMFHCHILSHAAGGMMGTIAVE